ncbi:hypothetical protein SNE35_26665 [Paucibacter sp. R3-3]|uniref:Uncharacterized protein n=1 Tax=Roseateles agri TaxID=3098619 RepID=A0ABU5DP64_9BURK|nr:hypothetical protein [Paucibacter sp. R3-3]MDY0748112.1 hypothetical protein [Paucibacter sp. R3-3]
MDSSDASPIPSPSPVIAAWCFEARKLLKLNQAQTARSIPQDDMQLRVAKWAQARDAAFTSGQQALETARLQFTELQSAFRSGGGLNGVEIAEQGLPAILMKLLMPLETSLDQLTSALNDDKTGLQSIQSMVTAAREELKDDSLLMLLETNPYKVAFSVRSDLTRALGLIVDVCSNRQELQSS